MGWSAVDNAIGLDNANGLAISCVLDEVHIHYVTFSHSPFSAFLVPPPSSSSSLPPVNDAFVMDAWGTSVSAHPPHPLPLHHPLPLYHPPSLPLVNDAFVMDAWGKSVGAGDKVIMLADGNGAFTKALGVELDLTDKGLGVRSRR